ncbi:AraC family transcriptional regulator [Affinibrenneria salicis]|uniref:AraC family transcriptional regulator n=1 Tax=Affinibrenneria salicis TaxID=2590031 RepID=A0A5J5G625_9GAMM|nr:AraC family transcriptional regulator [Affinibrenneria salicis]KAA9001926.1 AraC family transcriptional regulator [Affinibrenneria salicis]
MAKRVHHVAQHCTGIAGVEAMTMLTEHAFPRHSHDHFGIGVMTSGAQRSWSDMGLVESRAGDIIMVNPGEIHDGAPVGGVRGWHIIYLAPNLLMREAGDDVAPGDLTIRPVAQDAQLAGEILRFFRELSRQNSDPLAREEALLRCLMSVTQKHGVNGARGARKSPSVARAIQRLEQAPENPISLSELAGLCDMSRFQLLRGFARETGATPHAYLVQLRVRLARRLLAAGQRPADAALLAGFADQSHLTRAFVRQFGVTPARYQAIIRPAVGRNILQDPGVSEREN